MQPLAARDAWGDKPIGLPPASALTSVWKHGVLDQGVSVRDHRLFGKAAELTTTAGQDAPAKHPMDWFKGTFTGHHDYSPPEKLGVSCRCSLVAILGT